MPHRQSEMQSALAVIHVNFATILTETPLATILEGINRYFYDTPLLLDDNPYLLGIPIAEVDLTGHFTVSLLEASRHCC